MAAASGSGLDLTTEELQLKLAGITGNALLHIILGICDEIGLFRYLAAMERPQTSVEIAQGMKLNERYVREILYCLVSAELVRYHQQEGAFSMPPQFAPNLADDSSLVFGLALTTATKSFYTIREKLMGCIRNGGGVPFADFGPDMSSAIYRMNAPLSNKGIILDYVKAVPGLEEKLLNSPCKILDLGCGLGHASLKYAEAFPKCQIYGYDLDPGSVKIAKENAKLRGMSNATFEVHSAETLPSSMFDYILTLDVIHDVARPVDVLKCIKKALRPGGLYLMVEPLSGNTLQENIGARGVFLFSVSVMHCMTCSLANDGEGLGTCWNCRGPSLVEEYSKEAGFTSFQQLDFESLSPSKMFFALA